jgi:GntR family transcriptional regulator
MGIVLIVNTVELKMAPLYSAIEEDLARRIRAGEYAPTMALPTELELCDIYNVSRITVRRAIERLVASRLLYRKRGVGTFVNKQSNGTKSLRLTGYLQDVLTFDRKLTAKIVERGMVTPERAVAELFELDDGQMVYAIRAINSLDSKPYAMTHSYLAPNLTAIGAKIQMRSGKTSIRYIEDLTDIRCKSAEQTVVASAAGPLEARHLDIKVGAPILVATRAFFGDGPHPIEVVRVCYHPERYSLSAKLLASDSSEGDRLRLE